MKANKKQGLIKFLKLSLDLDRKLSAALRLNQTETVANLYSLIKINNQAIAAIERQNKR